MAEACCGQFEEMENPASFKAILLSIGTSLGPVGQVKDTIVPNLHSSGSATAFADMR